MAKNGERLSTLDLFGRGWVLLAEDGRWGPAVADAGEQLGVEVECLRVGADVLPPDPELFREAFGLGAAGAALVRPDGYVAWRSVGMPADPRRALAEALGRVSSADTTVSEAGRTRA